MNTPNHLPTRYAYKMYHSCGINNRYYCVISIPGHIELFTFRIFIFVILTLITLWKILDSSTNTNTQWRRLVFTP